MLNRKGFEFSFGWIFAIVVGAVFIFLAIYAATRFIGTERDVQSTEVAKQIDILLNPLSTGLEEGRTAQIEFGSETRVFNNCTLNSVFGEQRIGAAVSSDIGGNKWQDAGVSSKSYEKYLFSKGIIEGKEMIVFSKPFNFPYKVGDLMFAWSDSEKYCFVNPPNQIKEDIQDLKPKNIFVNDSKSKCASETIKVCFAETGCDVDVSVGAGKVTKKGRSVYYKGDLVYGAIFADSFLYECQLKRLMKRTAALAEIYAEKSKELGVKGCPSGIENELISYARKTAGMKDSSELGGIFMDSESIGRANDNLVCELF